MPRRRRAAKALRTPPASPSRGRTSRDTPGEGPEDLVIERKPALLLLGKKDLPIDHDVEDLLTGGLDARDDVELLLDGGRETRGPSLGASEHPGIANLDIHRGPPSLSGTAKATGRVTCRNARTGGAVGAHGPAVM
jgi:hypothetical protein